MATKVWCIKTSAKKRILFTQGLPDLSKDLHEINPEYNNILVFDDLMSQATDSPVLSKLVTQGRHRNASVILLLQNMFQRGKYNTDISRNAQYLVLFRSPSDRKQIGIVAERIFTKDRRNYMSAYVKETEKPYGYILIDNQPKTTSEKQVISDVFGQCKSYPHISTQSEKTHVTTDVQSPITGNVKCPLPKQPVKRKPENEKPPAKKAKTVKLTAKKVKTLPKTQSKSKPKYPIAKMRWESFTPRNSHFWNRTCNLMNKNLFFLIFLFCSFLLMWTTKEIEIFNDPFP